MRDPYCGWNIRRNICEHVDSNVNLVALNENLCSRFHRQESVKTMLIEQGSSAKLDCNMANKYLMNHVEWTKDNNVVHFNENIFLTDSKGAYLERLDYICSDI